MTKDHDNGTVKFTVKELLGDLRADIKRIDEKLDRKAEAGVLASAVSRIETLAGQWEQARVERGDLMKEVRELREQSISREAIDKYKAAFVGGGLIVVLNIILTIVQVFR
jgi:hypothetical protein